MAGPFSTAEHGNAIWIVFVYFNIVTEYRITSVAKVFVVFNSDAYALRMRLRNSASFALKWYMYEFHFALQIYGTVYTMVCMLCIEHFILFSVSFSEILLILSFVWGFHHTVVSSILVFSQKQKKKSAVLWMT